MLGVTLWLDTRPAWQFYTVLRADNNPAALPVVLSPRFDLSLTGGSLDVVVGHPQPGQVGWAVYFDLQRTLNRFIMGSI